MSGARRILLTWLLCLALPLQGFAATTMMLCGPNHHLQGGSQAGHAGADIDHAHLPAHGHESADHADHAGHLSSHGVTASDASDADETAGSFAMPDDTPNGKCSLCAACCGAAALASTTLSVAAVPAHAVYTVAGVSRTTSRALAGLERPPRIHLA